MLEQFLKIIIWLNIFFILPAVAGNQNNSKTFAKKLVTAALERTQHQVTYDGRYLKLKYPNGDVPASIGVCTDVIIRAYRQLNIDLQKDVHEDMQKNFKHYPKLWGLQTTDNNIDHRRVPNLQTLFKRKGVVLPVSNDGTKYQAGELVTWMLPGNLPHIGIVTDKKSSDGKRPLIVHNIGAGPKLEDMLFNYPITGRYYYKGLR